MDNKPLVLGSHDELSKLTARQTMQQKLNGGLSYINHEGKKMNIKGKSAAVFGEPAPQTTNPALSKLQELGAGIIPLNPGQGTSSAATRLRGMIDPVSERLGIGAYSPPKANVGPFIASSIAGWQQRAEKDKSRNILAQGPMVYTDDGRRISQQQDKREEHYTYSGYAKDPRIQDNNALAIQAQLDRDVNAVEQGIRLLHPRTEAASIPRPPVVESQGDEVLKGQARRFRNTIGSIKHRLPPEKYVSLWDRTMNPKAETPTNHPAPTYHPGNIQKIKKTKDMDRNNLFPAQKRANTNFSWSFSPEAKDELQRSALTKGLIGVPLMGLLGGWAGNAYDDMKLVDEGVETNKGTLIGAGAGAGSALGAALAQHLSANNVPSGSYSSDSILDKFNSNIKLNYLMGALGGGIGGAGLGWLTNKLVEDKPKEEEKKASWFQNFISNPATLARVNASRVTAQNSPPEGPKSQGTIFIPGVGRVQSGATPKVVTDEEMDSYRQKDTTTPASAATKDKSLLDKIQAMYGNLGTLGQAGVGAGAGAALGNAFADQLGMSNGMAAGLGGLGGAGLGYVTGKLLEDDKDEEKKANETATLPENNLNNQQQTHNKHMNQLYHELKQANEKKASSTTDVNNLMLSPAVGLAGAVNGGILGLAPGAVIGALNGKGVGRGALEGSVYSAGVLGGMTGAGGAGITLGRLLGRQIGGEVANTPMTKALGVVGGILGAAAGGTGGGILAHKLLGNDKKEDKKEEPKDEEKKASYFRPVL